MTAIAKAIHRLGPTELVIDIETQVRGDLADKLVAAAERMKRRPIDLVADLITTVIADDLWNAVLEE